jgi:membrane-associated phospholipid phosphatase
MARFYHGPQIDRLKEGPGIGLFGCARGGQQAPGKSALREGRVDMQLRTTVPRGSGRPAPPWERLGDPWTVALWLLAGAISIWGVMSLIGLLLTHIVDRGPAHAADLNVNQWFAHHRTSFWNDATAFGTGLAETITVIVVTVVVAAFLRWRTKRWYEALILITAVVGELVIFLSVTATVPQRRPPVARLDPAPATSSYPSGHTGVSLCLYGCIALLVLWLFAGRPGARILAAVLCCVPVVVGMSRIYRGMHYPSDVLAGLLLAGLWLSLVVRTLRPQRPWRRRAIRAGGRTIFVPPFTH